MKKLFLLATVLLVVVATFGFGVHRASAKSIGPVLSHSTPEPLPPVLVVDSPLFEGLKAGQHLHAQMYIDSNFQNIYCIVLNSNGEVQCQFPKKYAEHAAILHIEMGGQTLLFWVTIPKVREPVLKYD